MLLCTNNFRNSPGLAFHRIPKARHIPREYVRLLRNSNLKLNSESTRICILLVFLEVKSPRHILDQLHIVMFFFLSIPPSVLLFCAVLSPFKHSTSLSEVSYRVFSLTTRRPVTRGGGGGCTPQAPKVRILIFSIQVK